MRLNWLSTFLLQVHFTPILYYANAKVVPVHTRLAGAGMWRLDVSSLSSGTYHIQAVEEFQQIVINR